MDDPVGRMLAAQLAARNAARRRAEAKEEDDEVDFVVQEAGFARREPATRGRGGSAAGRGGRKRAAPAEEEDAWAVDEESDGGGAGRSSKKTKSSDVDPDFEKFMAELTGERPAAKRGRKAREKPAAEDGDAAGAAPAAGGGGEGDVLRQADSAMRAVDDVVARALRMAEAAAQGALSSDDDDDDNGGDADDRGGPKGAAAGSRGRGAAPAPAAAAQDTRSILVKVASKGRRGDHLELQVKLKEPLSGLLARARASLGQPKGVLTFEGRVLKPTDTPAGALDAEAIWEEAQEDGEDPVVMVDFVVP